MKTLTLDPDALRVQSFAAVPEVPAPPAAEATRPHVCDPLTAWC